MPLGPRFSLWGWFKYMALQVATSPVSVLYCPILQDGFHCPSTSPGVNRTRKENTEAGNGSRSFLIRSRESGNDPQKRKPLRLPCREFSGSFHFSFPTPFRPKSEPKTDPFPLQPHPLDVREAMDPVRQANLTAYARNPGVGARAKGSNALTPKCGEW